MYLYNETLGRGESSRMTYNYEGLEEDCLEKARRCVMFRNTERPCAKGRCPRWRHSAELGWHCVLEEKEGAE